MKYVFIVLVLSIVACDNNQNKLANISEETEVTQVDSIQDSADDSISTKIKIDTLSKSAIEKMLLILEAYGYKSDSIGLEIIMKSAYQNLRNRPFLTDEENIYVEIDKSKLPSADLTNCLSHGVGYFLKKHATRTDALSDNLRRVKDSNIYQGKFIPSEVGIEHWTVNDSCDLTLDKHVAAISGMPHPFPVYGMISDNSLIIIYNRQSINFEFLEFCLEYSKR